MIRRIVICMLPMLMGFGTFAQQTDTVPRTSGYISVGFGATVPVGAFAAPSGSNFGGYAAPGSSRFVSGGLVVNKYKVGFVITEGAYECWFKTSNYIGNLKPADTIKNATFGRQGGEDWYAGGYGLLGVLVSIKAHKLNLDLKVMGGRFTEIFPEISYYETGYGPSGKPVYTEVDYLPTETYSLGFAVGADARYAFTKHFCAMVSAEYLYTSFFYSTIENYTSTPVGNSSVITMLNFTAGVGYSF